MALLLNLRLFSTSVIVPALLGLIVSSAVAARGQEQQSSQQQGSQSQQSSQTQQSAQADPNSTATKPKDSDTTLGELPVKRRRVWTNDEVVGLRSPTDAYLADKDARAAAAARAAARAAAEVKLSKEDDSAKQAEPTVKLPITVEETEKLVKDKQDQISDEQAALDRLIKEMPDAPEDQKPAMQKEIDRITTDVPKVRQELRVLQDYLDKLVKARLNENAAPPPSPPSQ
jgi:hypothetical protein